MTQQRNERKCEGTALERQRWNIVIIDDNPDDRANFRSLLLQRAERRYTFIEVETAMAGIALLRDTSQPLPDCVLLDFSLPDMDAPELLASLNRVDDLLAYPVVVLTGDINRTIGRQILRAGAQDFLGKGGLTPDILTRAVENAVERQQMACELRDQAATLRARERELQLADRQKDEFLATLAHELRNPLAPLSNGLEILRYTEDAATAPIRQMMERQVVQLVRLVDDLLDISRINSGKLELRCEHMLLTSAIELALETIRPLVSAANHQLHVHLPDKPLWINGDLIRLSQVIGNLLNNSVKYTPAGGQITLTVTSEDDRAVIRIADNGVGIAPSMLDQVFDLFTQVDHRGMDSKGGLGVGLSLVRRLVEMHHGDVSAKSAGLELGSEFAVRLPLLKQSTARQESAPPVPVGDDRTSLRILVVYDNFDGAESLATLLTLEGHETRTARTGEEALAICDTFAPHVGFLDIGLPGMSGYVLAQMLRKEPALADIRLVAITGWGTDNDRRQSREAGFDVHLTKPVEADRIRQLLAGLSL
ncbi:MAG: response regulator [Gemmatimonadaceae bacterium]